MTTSENDLVEKVARETEINKFDVREVIEFARPIIERETLKGLLASNANTFRDKLPSRYLVDHVERYATEHNISLDQGEDSHE